MTASLKRILSDVPGGLFSDEFLARYTFPPEFPTLDMVPNVTLNSSLKELGMEDYITDTNVVPPKPDTHETRLCLPLGSMRSREVDNFCNELARCVGPVVVRPQFRKSSGLLNQSVPQSVEPPKVEETVVDAMPKISDNTLLLKDRMVRSLYTHTMPQVRQQPGGDYGDHSRYVGTPGTSMSHTLDAVTDLLLPGTYETDGGGQPPEPVHVTPTEHDEEDLPPLEPEKPATSTNNTMKEPVPQVESESVAPAWISVRDKKQPESSSDDESNSILAGDESSADISEQRGDSGHSDESSAYESDIDESSEQDAHVSPPKLSQLEEEDSVSSDVAPQHLEQPASPTKKRKVRDRKARNTTVEPFEVDHGMKLVENAKGKLVPEKKAKSKKADKKKKKKKMKHTSAKTSNKRAAKGKGKKPQPKRQMKYKNPLLNYGELFTQSKLDQFQLRDSDLYQRLRKMWLNTLWIAAYNLYGDPKAQDPAEWPHQPTFTGVILTKARESLDRESPEIMRAIYTLSGMELSLLSNNQYRIRLSAPMQNTIDLFPYESLTMTCTGVEYKAVVRAHYALRPTAYLMCIAKKICHETKNLPQATGSAQKLYDHNKANGKQADSVFIDWANMALLSRFEIIE